ncbi:hypothetical protein O6H91_06G064400 [Diphasiastrum complanatum]|uniref:Uncharacterized protein n=2 Tax=Diphasiastrum complanatum TaxID=34168 RepID=A0ACC2A756_DIPCM|nr:hypothetical protein O6H91_24G001700 [Diphasiastrum complanatum]KAJ7552679.1 hypothetical protein O6H91_06G064400 [Diphasiastrum complanatum]
MEYPVRMGADNACSTEAEVEVFDDFLPIMARKLGEEGLMEELCNGFRLLADPQTGTITLKSLKENVRLLGLEEMNDDQLQAMIKEGDFDRDGCLNQQEFCILMLRLSPSLMVEAQQWLEDALAEELECFMEEAY